MRNDIEALKAEQAVMSKSYKQKEAEMAEMVVTARKDIKEIQRLVKQAQETLQKSDAEAGLDIQKTRKELEIIRGKTEELDFRMAKLEQEVKIFKEDVDLRLQGGLAESLPEDASELLKLGESYLAEKKFREARKVFEAFIRRFPKDSRVSRARYNLGEAYTLQDQTVSAIFEYQKVLKNHGRSKEAAAATYRIGEGFRKLGKCKEAKLFFDTVLSEYRRSAYAKQAKKQLSDIKDGKCP